MVGAVCHHAWTDTSPVSYCFWAGSVTIMTNAKQKDSQLNFDWGLGGVGIIVEDFMGTDLVDNAIESVGVNADCSPVLIEVAGVPIFEERVL